VLGLRETEILDLADPRLDKPAIKILRSSPEISELAVLPSIPAFTRISITSSDEAEIATVDDLAELSIDELLDIQRLDKEVASAIIMTARENEGWFK
jgi:transcription termination factor NusA